MAYRSPEYKGRKGTYKSTWIEQFQYEVPEPDFYTFTSGTMGSAVLFELSSSVIGEYSNVNAPTKFCAVLLRTEYDESSKFLRTGTFSSLVSAGGNSTYNIQSNLYPTFDPQDDFLTVWDNNSPYGQPWTYTYISSGEGIYNTFSGFELGNNLFSTLGNFIGPSGERVYSFFIKPSQTIKFIKHQSDISGFQKQVKIWFYNMTIQGGGGYPAEYTFSASYSVASVLHLYSQGSGPQFPIVV